MSLSPEFLVQRFKRGDPAAMRQLGRLILEGYIEQPPDVTWRPEILLIRAAAGADRKAGWLLCKAYLAGWGGIPRNREKACLWKVRTDRRIRSDAQADYATAYLKREAVALNRAWQHWLKNNWVDQATDRLDSDSDIEALPTWL